MINSVYKFIAELSGSKFNTPEEKLAKGKELYASKARLYGLSEQIWAERLYDELDAYNKDSKHKWSVPIELDASASMVSIMGALLGNRDLLKLTNACYEGVLNDTWYIEGIERELVKAVYQPKLYGSSGSVKELFNKRGIEYTDSDVDIMNNALKDGPFGLFDSFKVMLINCVEPKEEMNVKIWNDSFTIKCNKFSRVGEERERYDVLWEGLLHRIVHMKTVDVPDLERFKLYFLTLLIHNIDSQIMNNILAELTNKHPNIKAIHIHDAVVVLPQYSELVRELYADQISDLHSNRHEILLGFMESIGLRKQYMYWRSKHRNQLDQLPKDWRCSVETMK